jgi:hypothetical protein
LAAAGAEVVTHEQGFGTAGGVLRLVTVDGQESNVVVLAVAARAGAGGGVREREADGEGCNGHTLFGASTGGHGACYVAKDDGDALRMRLKEMAPPGSELARALSDGAHLRVAAAPHAAD